jgi:acyl carrier protein
MTDNPSAPPARAPQDEFLDRRSSQQIQAWIVSHMASLLDVPEAKIDVSRTFEQYGLDSIAAVALLSDLGVWLGQDLDTNLIDRDATLASLSAQLADLVRV